MNGPTPLADLLPSTVAEMAAGASQPDFDRWAAQAKGVRPLFAPDPAARLDLDSHERRSPGRRLHDRQRAGRRRVRAVRKSPRHDSVRAARTRTKATCGICCSPVSPAASRVSRRRSLSTRWCSQRSQPRATDRSTRPAAAVSVANAVGGPRPVHTAAHCPASGCMPRTTRRWARHCVRTATTTRGTWRSTGTRRSCGGGSRSRCGGGSQLSLACAGPSWKSSSCARPGRARTHQLRLELRLGGAGRPAVEANRGSSVGASDVWRLDAESGRLMGTEQRLRVVDDRASRSARLRVQFGLPTDSGDRHRVDEWQTVRALSRRRWPSSSCSGTSSCRSRPGWSVRKEREEKDASGRNGDSRPFRRLDHVLGCGHGVGRSSAHERVQHARRSRAGVRLRGLLLAARPKPGR
jgi:hypothetical protein